MWRQSDFISPTAAKALIRWPSIMTLDGGGFLHLANLANWLLTGRQAFPRINPEGIQTEGGNWALGNIIWWIYIIWSNHWRPGLGPSLLAPYWAKATASSCHHYKCHRLFFGCPHQVSGTQPVSNTQSLVYERCHPHHRQTYNMLQPKFFEYAVYHYMPWMLL